MRVVGYLLGCFALTNAQLFGGLPVPGASTLTNAASKATSAITPQVLEKSFGSFQDTFKKTYDNPQIAALRKGIFKDNLETINKFNEEFKNGLKPFELGINEFIDLASAEFNKLFNGFGRTRDGKKLTKPKADPAPAIAPTSTIPDHVDWREKGAVTPIKHQGQCASCYTFSAAGALEGQIFKKTGNLVELSPQNLLDCSSKPPYENDGCNGGYTDITIDYIKKNNGINIDSGYPYEAKASDCRYKPDNVGGNATGCAFIPQGNEKALEAAVAEIGPISAALDASHPTFQNYKAGIYYEPECANDVEHLNHAVLVVGYGVDEKTKDKYWIVKNTYGTGWGENGYFRLAKDKNNHCGIASWAVYPKI